MNPETSFPTFQNWGNRFVNRLKQRPIFWGQVVFFVLFLLFQTGASFLFGTGVADLLPDILILQYGFMFLDFGVIEGLGGIVYFMAFIVSLGLAKIVFIAIPSLYQLPISGRLLISFFLGFISIYIVGVGLTELVFSSCAFSDCFGL